ncbi:LOW QUALITY PROTEIN: purine nucleoside phosphorylase LACC1-like [Gigantopelta aegis]|uniref:LOW QUALITY PROTEIN: purine nucleoside phosphorylase LACC1-like n=1 Tax=Gigantopelta aegis TaxID=1735272 RepID=UPI001B88A7C2|nr:LOW QUALITY PROTEIN: purine nucleoside phosphorylase LACC1-like [Gigantopelta aegis]
MEEKRAQRRAYVVDMYDQGHRYKHVIVKLCHLVNNGSDAISEHHVMLLAPSSDDFKNIIGKPELRDVDGVFVNPICVENKIEAFYEAKEQIDDQKINRIVLVCSTEQSGYWKQLSEIFFTKIYRISVEMVGDGGMEMTATYGFHNEVEQFLKSLPSNGPVEVLCTPIIPNNIFNHGFTTRTGGISSIPSLRSLNLMYAKRKQDPMVVIKENRRRLAEAAGFNPFNFQLVKAEHSNRVWTIGRDAPSGYDAIVTKHRGLAIASPGADCVTVIFADPVNMVCGTAHAGWRGTLKGITRETIRAMVKDFGCDVRNIWPNHVWRRCVCRSTRKTQNPLSRLIRRPWCQNRVTRKSIDLLKVNRILLEREGVLAGNIDDTSASKCTACNPGQFFSFRRDKFPFGNQVAFICIRE